MKPRAIRSEQELAWARPADGFHNVIEPAHSGSVSVDISITHELIDYLLVRLPVVPEAPQVRDDEVDVGVLTGQHLHYRRLADHIHQHGQSIGTRRLANFARWHGVVAVYLDPPESPLRHG